MDRDGLKSRLVLPVLQGRTKNGLVRPAQGEVNPGIDPRENS
jgi:hypothetical protein